MSELYTRIQMLRQQADQPAPEAWKPAPGEWTAGVVRHIEMRPTRFQPVPVVTIANENGIEQSVWLLHTVLRNEFRKARIMPGELVFIRYDGKREPEGGGSAYDHYTVRVDRAEQPFDWTIVDAIEGGHQQGSSSSPGADYMPSSPVADDEDIPF